MTRTRLSGRLTRAEDATAQFVEPLAIVDHGAANGDADALATELAAAFRQKIENYRKWYKLSEQEAIDRVSKESAVPQQARALHCPPQKLSWQALEEIAEGDPERAQQRWEEVRQAAREELRSGHRAARFIEGRDSSCWDRAQFLALRAELSEAWLPRNAQEQHLVDQLAQWQALLEEWQNTLIAYTNLACGCGSRAGKEARGSEPPRASDVEAVEAAAAMVERLQRLYLRALRALQDQRRLGPRRVIRRAAQVNSGHRHVKVVGADDVPETGSMAG